ncbi:MAG: hypothetical protein WC712_09170 [Candidatus Brocadiia bacterium]
MSATIHPFQSFARSVCALLILAFLLLGSIPAAPADEVNTNNLLREIRRYLGQHNGRYWFMIDTIRAGLRLWAYNEADRRGTRIPTHEEFLNKVEGSYWDWDGKTVWYAGGGHFCSFDLDTSTERKGAAFEWLLTVGPAGLFAVGTKTGVDVIRFDGSVAISRECDARGSNIEWVTPTALAVASKNTGDFVVLDCTTGNVVEFPGIKFGGRIFGDAFALRYPVEYEEDGRKHSRYENRAVVFDGLTPIPAPYDADKFGLTGTYGLRAERADDEVLMGVYDTSGTRVFNYWTASFPDYDQFPWKMECPPRIAIEGDQVLRISYADSSLWFYDRKTGLTLDGIPLAEAVACSTERVNGKLGVFYADGSIVYSNNFDHMVQTARIPVDRHLPLSIFCVPHDGGSDQDMFYAWNGKGLYRVGSSCKVETSPFHFAPGTIVVLSDSEPLIAVGIRTDKDDSPVGIGEYCFSIYELPHLFAPDPKWLAQFHQTLDGKKSIREIVHFIGDTGFLLVDGDLIRFRESNRKRPELPPGQTLLFNSHENLIVYGVWVPADNFRHGAYVCNVFDSSRGKDLFQRQFYKQGYLFLHRMMPGVACMVSGGRDIRFIYGLGEGEEPLTEDSGIYGGVGPLYWDDGLCLLCRNGLPTGKLNLPSKTAQYLEKRKARQAAEGK